MIATDKTFIQCLVIWISKEVPQLYKLLKTVFPAQAVLGMKQVKQIQFRNVWILREPFYLFKI